MLSSSSIVVIRRREIFLYLLANAPESSRRGRYFACPVRKSSTWTSWKAWQWQQSSVNGNSQTHLHQRPMCAAKHYEAIWCTLDRNDAYAHCSMFWVRAWWCAAMKGTQEREFTGHNSILPALVGLSASACMPRRCTITHIHPHMRGTQINMDRP